MQTTHNEILKDPEPLAVFSSFGESSIDFRLLFWIATGDLKLQVQTEVALMINEALKKAGIGIPFPQRDLNVKFADQSAANQLMKGGKLGFK